MVRQFDVEAMPANNLTVNNQYRMMLDGIAREAESMYIQDFDDEIYDDTLTAIRDALFQKRITLPVLIAKVYDYEKEQFTREQLQTVFTSIGLHFIPNQLESLFRNLDTDFTGMISTGKLNRAVGNQLLESRLSIRSNLTGAWLEQLARNLRNTGPYQTLQSFDQDSDGILSLTELLAYMASIGLDVEERVVNRMLFSKSRNASISELLAALGIQPGEQFVELSNDSMLCSLAEMSKSMISSSCKQKTEIRIKEIGRSSIGLLLEPFLNPCAQMEEPLLSIAAKHLSSRRMFHDDENPTPKASLAYKHAREIFQDNYFLFEVQKSIVRLGIGTILDSRNIIQGKGKDCYFLSAAAGVVEHYPEFIYRLFVLDKNPSDVYGVRLFVDGQWKTIVVDARFPVDEKGVLFYAKPYRSEIWVLLLEKAWAKIYGSYDNIEGGNPEEGLTALTGAPCLKMTGDDPMIIQKLRHNLQQNYIVTANTSDLVNKMDKNDQKQRGIYENHAYTVVGLFENLPWKRDGKIEQITLVKIRNPWGRGSWKGSWSFDCPLWTRQLRQQLNYTKDPKNGTFFMSVTDFVVMFGTMKVCQLSPINQNSSLRLVSAKKEFVFAKITVSEQGIYFVSIYQEGSRKHKVEPAKAKHACVSHIFVASATNNGFLLPIGSKTHNRQKNHMEVWLAAGEYVVFCRLKWSHVEQGQFVLGCYGPRRVRMQPMQPSPKYVFDYVQAKAVEEKGSKTCYSSYGRPESYKNTYISTDEGYGYMTFSNNSYQLMKVEMQMTDSRGVKAISPGSLPLNVMVPPKSRYSLCLLVEPKCKYAIQENIQFI